MRSRRHSDVMEATRHVQFPVLCIQAESQLHAPVLYLKIWSLPQRKPLQQFARCCSCSYVFPPCECGQCCQRFGHNAAPIFKVLTLTISNLKMTVIWFSEALASTACKITILVAEKLIRPQRFKISDKLFHSQSLRFGIK
jgi:hypothetical protein